MLKFTKILLPVAWMGLIYVLSDIPYELVPIKTTNAQQIIAHIFLYGVLAYLIILAIQCWQVDSKKNSVNTWKINFFVVTFCIFYGITDEYHQGFVRGRFASFFDLGFDTIGAIISTALFVLTKSRKKPKLLLHICCAGCGAYVSQLLKLGFKVTLYFYNPNIYPNEEHDKRMAEVTMIAKKFNLKVITNGYDHDSWRELVKGHEADIEKGERCMICYRSRLESTAKVARDNKFNYFATSLTISPHKDAKSINRVGNDLASKYGVNPSTGAQSLRYLDKDFKKQDGFKKSVELSKELDLHRQDYCGCEFSKKTTSK